MTAARRFAAILAIDVVGQSRLMGEGGAGTAREHWEPARSIDRGYCARECRVSPHQRRSRQPTTSDKRPAGVDPKLAFVGRGLRTRQHRSLS